MEELATSLQALAAEERANRERRARVLAEDKLKEVARKLAEYESRDAVLQKLDEQKIRGHARTKGQPATGKSTAILCCTDWHCEETVDPKTVSNLNKYNMATCDARIKKLQDKSLEMLDSLRTFADVAELVLWLGGDMITGQIHEELMEGNECGPVDAIVFVEERVCDIIATLRKHTNLPVRVIGNWGNHGRSTAKKRIATGAATSWEYLAYQHLARLHAADPNVDVFPSRGYHMYWNACGHTVRFHHGDAIRYAGGIGGISVPVNKAISSWNKSKRADIDIFGHWHQYIEEWRWVSCGCLIGYSPFAIQIKADYQPPTQTLVLVSQHHGKCLSLPLFVDDKKGASRASR